MRIRGFEIAKGYEDKDIHLPIRKTKNSAAYDIEAAEDVTIPPFKLNCKPTLIPTGLKAYCQDDEWYMLANRSGGPKKGLIMANSIGIIDADYYENETNDGHFMFQYYNILDHDIEIKKGEAIGQIVFMKYLKVDNDNANGVRKGGFGSTDNN
ncbi:MAG: dUTP diphosphatase [Ruminococcus sp.]|nr:dUTP diphosphatase [Ruminococcus sp.]